MLYTHRIPSMIPFFFPSFLWHIQTEKPVIYLTFDDGPIPEVTDFVLEQLLKVQAKATFFCVGDNIRKHPEVFERLLREEHAVGNHTVHHLNGWKTENEVYLQEVTDCQQRLPEEAPLLFRPPYGAIVPAQARALREQGYRIVMWDVLTGDFDPQLSPESCLENAIRHTRPGSIVVFHDSLKAYRNLEHTLPRYLEYFHRQGFAFDTLNQVLTSDIH